jgi:hypothetical protein
LGGRGRDRAGPPRATEQSDFSRKFDALFAAQQFVKRSLKAPATADFAPYRESVIVDLGDHRFEVTSYVDAQNSFGAKLRNHFTCVVRKTETKGFVLESLELQE